MGIKIAKALGHYVVAISTSEKKREMALQKGANSFVVSTDPDSINALAHKCDIILNTVSAPHDLNVYLQLLNYNGILVQLGLVSAPHTIHQFPLMLKRHSICGSFIGGKLCESKNGDGLRYVIDVKKSLLNKDFMVDD